MQNLSLIVSHFKPFFPFLYFFIIKNKYLIQISIFNFQNSFDLHFNLIIIFSKVNKCHMGILRERVTDKNFLVKERYDSRLEKVK